MIQLQHSTGTGHPTLRPVLCPCCLLLQLLCLLPLLLLLLRPLLALHVARTECLDHMWVCLNIGALHEVDAGRDGLEHLEG